MSSRTIRMMKEAGPLFWPWCAVIIAGVLPLVHPLRSTDLIFVLGFLVGIPLLAALPLGNEFQHRTLSLLLTQPVDRVEIWGEKLSVMAVAVLSADLVFFLGSRVGAVDLGPNPSLLAGPWVIAIMASATFWTLFARSTIGGVALNMVNTFIFSISAQSLNRFHGKGGFSLANPVDLAITFVFLCYAGAMLWLGWRKLARFQVTGGMAGDDLLMAGPDVLPGALAAWFRCRPNGAVVNLIRKELRLLRPLWLITLLAALGWTCFIVLSMVLERGSAKNLQSDAVTAFVLGVVGISTLILAILAGSLSLGEEKTSGTHSWHMTLPVSIWRQWLVKLLMALFASVVCAVLLGGLGLIACGFLFRSPFKFADVQGIPLVLMVLLLTFASFWCACAVNGTVRVAMWVFPALIAVGLACVFGEWAGRELVDFFVARFDLFTSFRFAATISRLGTIVLSRLIDAASENMMYSEPAARVLTATMLIPTLLLAVIQSYRLYRARLQDRAFSVVRRLLPLAMTAFLCSFSLLAFFTFVEDATGQTGMLLFGTHHAIEEILPGKAIEKTPPGVAGLDATHPLQLTGDDVEKALKARPFLLSDNTRRWLRNARITVAPDKSHPSSFSCVATQWGSWGSTCYFSATIHLADGTDLTESYEPHAHLKLPFGHFTVYVHWPGAAGQESLMDR